MSIFHRYNQESRLKELTRDIISGILWCIIIGTISYVWLMVSGIPTDVIYPEFRYVLIAICSTIMIKFIWF